jgi:aspartate ammonia-lyase
MSSRIESDLLGELQVPADAYYGVQTQRAIENFNITTARLYHFRHFIWGLGVVKLAAVRANHEMGLISTELKNAIEKACLDVMSGSMDKEFPVDMMQGGAGTSVNMNANEVIANKALEYMGHKKGQYEFCSPNDHVNMSQSTNDAYPSAIHMGMYKMNEELIAELKRLIESFTRKGTEFADVIKMGRTQLQDAVPMTLGQEFNAFANGFSDEINRLSRNSKLFLEVNMGATAIGTGICAVEGYSEKCVRHMAEITNLPVELAHDLVAATPDTSVFISYSSALKRLAVKMSKTCNDLRLLSSGPRAGLNEINLPPMQPGSSIMPGKVNPVIPEVMNQICYKVIGNDLTVTFAAEAGQLQLNVMEPVIAWSVMESIHYLMRGMETLRKKCIDGITANREVCKTMVHNSIGIVTALNPVIGYKNSTRIAKKALQTGRGVYEIIIEEGVLTKEQLNELLKPENMTVPGKAKK